MYSWFFKRLIDFTASLLGLLVLLPLLLVLMLVGWIALGGNPFFVQPRPGRKGRDGCERIFAMVKFRTMTNARDAKGDLLPDELRLTRYGKWLRSTSLDELPELFNCLVGDMSLVGPRPQLVRDLVFMSPEVRARHDVRPGITGLAQVSGRNALGWEERLRYDLEYVSSVTFMGDMRIGIATVRGVFAREGISSEGMATSEDYGDYLLRIGRVTQAEYEACQREAKELLGESGF